jgi:malonyl-CoA O-methyltransferase
MTPDHYASHAILQQTIAKSLAARLDLVRIAPEKILDLGAATGHASRLLARRYNKAQVIAVDLAKDRLSYARARRRWFSAQRFICADASALPFLAGHIDMIYANLLFSRSQPLEGILHECKRVLQPNGLLIFTAYGINSLRVFANGGDLQKSPLFYDIREIGQVLTQVGYQEIVLDMENFQFNYRDATKLHAELQTVLDDGQLGLQKLLDSSRGLGDPIQTLTLDYEIIYGLAWAPPNLPKAARDTMGDTMVPIQNIRRPSRIANAT